MSEPTAYERCADLLCERIQQPDPPSADELAELLEEHLPGAALITVPEHPTPALNSLSPKYRLFVEALASGFTGVESAKYAGSSATTRSGFASYAQRAKQVPAVMTALDELRALEELDDESLVNIAMRGLRDIIKSPDKNRSATVRACEIVLKKTGKLVSRHEHAHLHASIGDLADLTPEEELAEAILHTRMRLFTLAPEERERFMREIATPDVSGMLPKDRVLDVAGEVV